MKAIKINVKTQTVEQVEFSGNFREIYKLLEIGDRPFTIVYQRKNGDCLYVDDEGLLIPKPIGAFTTTEYGSPLSGHGLIIGTDSVGESINCVSTVDEIRDLVKFLPIQILKHVQTGHDVIPLTDKEFAEYLMTGKLPLGKQPQNLN